MLGGRWTASVVAGGTETSRQTAALPLFLRALNSVVCFCRTAVTVLTPCALSSLQNANGAAQKMTSAGHRALIAAPRHHFLCGEQLRFYSRPPARRCARMAICAACAAGRRRLRAKLAAAVRVRAPARRAAAGKHQARDL